MLFRDNTSQTSGAHEDKDLGDQKPDVSRDQGPAPDLSLHELQEFKENHSEEEYLSLVSQALGITLLKTIQTKDIQSELIANIPIHFLKTNTLIPVASNGTSLTIAISSLENIPQADQLRIITDMGKLEFALAPQDVILDAINRLYESLDNKADSLLEEIHGDEGGGPEEELDQVLSEDLLDSNSEAPIIKLVNHILSKAVQNRASDIHIEPYQKSVQIRFRLDGVLCSQLSLPKGAHPGLISRIKILSQLNIAEKRIPQDGRIQIRIGNREVDLRVSTLPTAFGERVVLRLLEKDIRILNLSEIGLEKDNQTLFQKRIRLSHGIILVTGPTGSGKTTTLYSALSEINTPDKNILTIEDPIEYQLDGIGQMQVNSKIGLTFAKGLRTMVRQDPDVILVGEIRDLETAEIAIQAALTGHLVFSTLHTNDAPGAVTRLIDMGIEPFLVSSAVQTILAQRLVRTLCSHCRERYAPSASDLCDLGMLDCPQEGLFRATGCERCRNTGYKGRIGIFEVFNITDEIKTLILKTSESNQIRKLAMEQGMVSLRVAGVQKVLNGETTIEEVLRVTQA